MKTQAIDLHRFVDEPVWFTDLRQKALYQSIELPLPETRFTKFRGLDLHRIADIPKPSKPFTPKALDQDSTPFPSPWVFLFRNGRLEAAPKSTPRDVNLQIFPLDQALSHPLPSLKETFESWQPRDKLEALHLAYLSGGVVIFVPEGLHLEQPVYIQIEHQDGYTLAFHTWIFLGKGASLTLIQEERSTEEGYVSHVIHVHLEEGSHLNYGSIQSLGKRVYHVRRNFGFVGRYAHLDWSAIWLGGKLVQSKTETYLRGEGAEATDSQVFFGTQRQHIDLTSNLRHLVPNTQGFVFIQGVLKDRARAVLQGLIRIEPGAQNTNSYLEEHALLLNRGTHADTEPALEIEADEVRASHAATVSKIEDDQVFYLQTRGLSRPEAVKLIARGFLTPGIQKLKIPYIREHLDRLFDEKWGEK